MEQNLNGHPFSLVCRRVFVLGRLFFFLNFSLYINDTMVGIESEIRLFADDCVCYRQIDSIKDTSKLQKNIDQLANWARKWGMRL